MNKYLIPIFLMGTIVMMFFMAKTGAALKTPLTPHGIVDLELAYNIVKTSTVINAWSSTAADGSDRIYDAKINTYFDFIFIFCYVSFLFFASKKISASFKNWFGVAGKYFAKAAVLTGIFDVLENFGMLTTLYGQGSGAISFLTAFCSAIKWTLALLTVLYVFTGAAALFRIKIINRD